MAEKKKSAPVSTGPVKPEDKKKALETALAQIENCTDGTCDRDGSLIQELVVRPA